MAAPPAPLHWDLFCRVIDNYGDAGVCWRLAADLAARGHAVRLWIDDPAPLAFIAPAGEPGVTLHRWHVDDADADGAAPGDVVVEAFGCDPPAGFVARMAAAPRPPAWINLEYLSAEDYVERSHRLPSPQRNGLTKWFFYPGFTPATGGLLREPGLRAAREAFDRDAWLAALGAARQAGERVVVLFAYEHAPFAELLRWLAERPTLLLACAGVSQAPALAAAAGAGPALRVHALPWLAQPQFDRLLWSADLNLVRGEDSLVRAAWAGAPFVWHIYPQHDGAHVAKLDALLGRWQAAAGGDAPAAAVGALWRAWNGLATWPAAWPDDTAWRRANRRWRDALEAQDDLVTQLLRFVAVQSRQAQPL